MPPLTNIFGSDTDEPFEPGSYLPLQPLDGEEEIRTPHDDCLLVMPSLRAMPGQTAVRLARFVED